MVAPQDDDIRQSVRVLELQNKDLWLRPTDLPWHFSMLVTIREMPFKNHRGRSAEFVKAREKLEEAKKQKTLKNSWTWKTAHSSSCSAWRDWSSDSTRERSDWQSTADWNRSKDTRERSDWQSLADRNSSEKTRERTYWQPADWDRSDQICQATAWQSHYLWQRGHLHGSS